MPKDSPTRSTSAPSRVEQRGSWYDGRVARKRPVRVHQDPRHLVLIDEDGAEHLVAKADLVRLAAAGQPKFGHRSEEGWRLIFDEPIDPAILSALPRRGGGLAPSVSRRTVALLASGVFAISLLAGVVIFAPQAIAEHMPMSWERKLGAAYDLPAAMVRCKDPGAQAALNRMVDRLDPKARQDDFTIELADLDVANAAALPGGRMILLNGLFEEVDEPDAIAGIVAHEIAHVRRRHVAAAMVRELGLGTVVTLVGGGAIASNAGGLLSLKFSRSAEAEADGDAIAMLQRAGIDPRPTAAAFEQFRQMEGEFPEWLGDHPTSAGRAKAFAASYDAGAHYRPALEESEATALLTACSNEP